MIPVAKEEGYWIEGMEDDVDYPKGPAMRIFRFKGTPKMERREDEADTGSVATKGNSPQVHVQKAEAGSSSPGFSGLLKSFTGASPSRTSPKSDRLKTEGTRSRSGSMEDDSRVVLDWDVEELPDDVQIDRKAQEVYIGGDESEAYCVSLWQDEVSFNAVIRSSAGSKYVRCRKDSVPYSWWRWAFGWQPNLAEILQSMDGTIPAARLRPVKAEHVHSILEESDRKSEINRLKFGVLYVQSTAQTEDEIFANCDASPRWDAFLDLLGQRVTLQGFAGYNGGLDVRRGSTGSESVYTECYGVSVMFHVSTMLPFSPTDTQQLERKRHIGNDLVVVVFLDADDGMFRPSVVRSKQNHVFVVVQPVDKSFRIFVVGKKGVPLFEPRVDPQRLYSVEETRSILREKLLQAEIACYESPFLKRLLSRTRRVLLQDLHSRVDDPKK